MWVAWQAAGAAVRAAAEAAAPPRLAGPLMPPAWPGAPARQHLCAAAFWRTSARPAAG
jgi:hypothetical protein